MTFDFSRKTPIFRTILATLQGSGAYLALLMILLIGSLCHESFGTTGNLLNILRQSSFTGIIALGMTFVIIAGGIDLSVGSVFAFCGVASIELINMVSPEFIAQHPALSLLLLALLSCLTGLLCGILNGALVVLGKLPPFIATLGTYSVFRSLALYLADSGNATVGSTALADAHFSFCASKFLALPLPVWFFIVLTALLAVILSYTRLGRHCIATGSNERVALYSGISVARVRFFSYALIGLLAGISVFLMAGRMGGAISSSNAGALYELDAIAAVIIGGASMSGGRGNVVNTFVGALILAIIANLLDITGLNPSLQGTIKGLVVILSVLIQRKKS